MLTRNITMLTNKEKLRGMTLRVMLSAYMDWHYPSKYSDSPRYRQNAKDRYYRVRNMYKALKGKDV